MSQESLDYPAYQRRPIAERATPAVETASLEAVKASWQTCQQKVGASTEVPPDLAERVYAAIAEIVILNDPAKRMEAGAELTQLRNSFIHGASGEMREARAKILEKFSEQVLEQLHSEER